jgi:membrane associated rhomboid family serine protease
MITRILIGLNVIGFIWEITVAGPGMLSFMGGGNMERVLEDGSLYPAAVFQDHEWWRIFTSAFLHSGLLHIGVNMVSLWSLGRFIETIAGPWRMLLIYVVSLIASGLGVIFLSAPLVPTLGASGAIFGLFGALFAIGLKLGKPGMEMVKANIGILIVNIVISLTPGISWQAHLTGAIAGFALTYAIYFPPKRLHPVVVDAATGRELETEYEAPNEPRPHPPA